VYTEQSPGHYKEIAELSFPKVFKEGNLLYKFYAKQASK
jgi:hypothetical protein